MRGLEQREFFIPPSHRGLVIGKGGRTIQAICKDTETDIQIGDDGFSVIQGLTKTAVDAASEQINDILKTEVARVDLESEYQVRQLLRERGETIQRIQALSNTNIDVMRSALAVVITAPDTKQLETAIDLLKSSVTLFVEIIRVDPAKIGLIIGQSGNTIKQIQSDNGVVVDVHNDNSGRISVVGLEKQGVIKAVETIQQITGCKLVESQREYTIRNIADLRTPKPEKMVSSETLRNEPLLIEEFFSQPLTQTTTEPRSLSESIAKQSLAAVESFFATSGKQIEPPTQQASPLDSTIHTHTISVSEQQLDKLAQKRGDLVAIFFGASKSFLETIKEIYGVQIETNSNERKVTLSGYSKTAVETAAAQIDDYINNGSS